MSGRWLGFESPFCALTVAVDFDDGGVDHGVFHVWIRGDGLEHAPEDAGLHPVPEALVDRVPLPEPRRKVALWAAGPHNPQYRFDKQPSVPAGSPGISRLP